MFNKLSHLLRMLYIQGRKGNLERGTKPKCLKKNNYCNNNLNQLKNRRGRREMRDILTIKLTIDVILLITLRIILNR